MALPGSSHSPLLELIENASEHTKDTHEHKSYPYSHCACNLYGVASAIFFNPQKVNGSGNEAIDHTTIDTPSCSKLYNLQGQRLTTPPAHGVYILNGRKVVK